MSEAITSFEAAVAFALTLPDTILSTSYGKPAVKVESNGRAFLYTGHEDQSSFGIAIDLDTVERRHVAEIVHPPDDRDHPVADDIRRARHFTRPEVVQHGHRARREHSAIHPAVAVHGVVDRQSVWRHAE